MKWTDLPSPVLLQRSFLFGITGIILGALSILNSQFHWIQAPMGPLNGVSFLLQLASLGTAILVLRKRNVEKEHMEKAQILIMMQTVALLFFFFSL